MCMQNTSCHNVCMQSHGTLWHLIHSDVLQSPTLCHIYGFRYFDYVLRGLECVIMPSVLSFFMQDLRKIYSVFEKSDVDQPWCVVWSLHLVGGQWSGRYLDPLCVCVRVCVVHLASTRACQTHLISLECHPCNLVWWCTFLQMLQCHLSDRRYWRLGRPDNRHMPYPTVKWQH